VDLYFLESNVLVEADGLVVGLASDLADKLTDDRCRGGRLLRLPLCCWVFWMPIFGGLSRSEFLSKFDPSYIIGKVLPRAFQLYIMSRIRITNPCVRALQRLADELVDELCDWHQIL